MQRLYELSILALGWFAAGLIVAAPGATLDQRAGALVALAGSWIVLARLAGRRRRNRE